MIIVLENLLFLVLIKCDMQINLSENRTNLKSRKKRVYLEIMVHICKQI